MKGATTHQRQWYTNHGGQLVTWVNVAATTTTSAPKSLAAADAVRGVTQWSVKIKGWSSKRTLQERGVLLVGNGDPQTFAIPCHPGHGFVATGADMVKQVARSVTGGPSAL